METNIEVLQKLATENANKHGWKIYWDKTRCKKETDLTVGEALALISGEACGEALEEYRNDDLVKFAC